MADAASSIEATKEIPAAETETAEPAAETEEAVVEEAAPSAEETAVKASTEKKPKEGAEKKSA